MSVQTSQNTPVSNLLPGIAFGLIAALIWGAWPVLSRAGVAVGGSLNPYDITALRFGIAGLLLAPIVLRPGITAIGSVPLTLLTIGAGAPYVLTAVGGLALAPATHAGIIIPSCMMSFTALGSWLFLGESPSRKRLVGMFGILTGVCLVGFQAVTHDVGTLTTQTLIGDGLFVASGLLWSIYTLSAKRWGVPPLQATALVSVLSLILFLPAYGLFADWERISTIAVEELVSQGIIQGIFTGILALLFYTKAVAALGAARGSLFAALVPGIAALLSFPILGEAPTLLELIGLAVVTTGMVVAIRAS